jgi:hypothetical protein
MATRHTNGLSGYTVTIICSPHYKHKVKSTRNIKKQFFSVSKNPVRQFHGSLLCATEKIRRPFEKFVVSLYSKKIPNYSESELRGGAVTVFFRIR